MPVRIIGAIAAGLPIPVPSADTWQSDATDSIDVSPDMIGNRENVYGLRVKGTSMIDALINDGDVVIMEAANDAKQGEMVAVWLEKSKRPRSRSSTGRATACACSRRTRRCSRSTPTPRTWSCRAA